jgi:phosphomannomutase
MNTLQLGIMRYRVASMKGLSADAPLMLSVSGARGIVGATMMPAIAADFAAAFGTFIKTTSRQPQPVLCLGRDSRLSGEMLAHAAMAGLASVGCRVIDLGVVTTPSVAVMINHHRAAGGMIITASHNPIMWNGLKCLDADGIAPPPNQAREIIERFENRRLTFAAVEDIPQVTRDESTNQRHVQRVLAAIDPGPIRAEKFKVVLDSVNGAGCVPGRKLLDALGCDVVHINGDPTGRFAHTPEPIEENLSELKDRTRAENAACGFAQDPDADRLAIVDESGTFIGEEYTLVLAAMRSLELANQPDAPARVRRRNSTVIATNLSTSRMIDDVAARFPGTQVMRTAVGEANVVAALKPHGERALLGGEGNGGVILPDVCWVRDSLSAMALVLSLMAHSRQRLGTIIDSLPRYTMIKHKFDLASVGGPDAIRHAMEKVKARFAGEKLSTVDGVRVDFADGWVHLRPSNTEPIVRLIAEAKSDSRAWELIDEAAVAAGLK